MNRIIFCVVIFVCSGVHASSLPTCTSSPWDPRSCDRAGKEETPVSEQDKQVAELE